jgi:hypothetical protein
MFVRVGVGGGWGLAKEESGSVWLCRTRPLDCVQHTVMMMRVRRTHRALRTPLRLACFPLPCLGLCLGVALCDVRTNLQPSQVRNHNSHRPPCSKRRHAS